MGKILIQLFGFHQLKLSPFFDLGILLLVNLLTPELAKTLGISKAYAEAKEPFDKLTEIFRRNPMLLQTEKLTETIAKIRRKIIAIKATFKGMLGEAEGERLENVKLLENIARPYLKNVHNEVQSGLVANSIEMADALRTPANLPKLTKLGLKDIVDEIEILAKTANDILAARGEEEIFRQLMGNATDTRKKVEKHLRFLLYTAIPAHYAEATGALATTFEHTIMDIDGVLKSFRHLTTTGGGGLVDSGEGGVNIKQPEEPDTQPAQPPSGGGGGGFTDPDA
ncbi:MAG: DUF6261 family protein [Mediterranea sp.]|jgi:regulator of replication initiation timing|nr:DUF6261 family protein [Mediterranea sp.]